MLELKLIPVSKKEPKDIFQLSKGDDQWQISVLR